MQRPRGRVHEVCQEVTRVAELVLAARVRQGHHQVVALGETEQDVLHRRACSPCQTIHGKWMGKQCQTLFFWAPKSLQMVTAAMKLKDAYSLEGKL